MLTDGRFWIGAVVGAIGYHVYLSRKAARA